MMTTTTLASIAFILAVSCSGICRAFQARSVPPFRQLARRTFPPAERTTASLSRLRRNLSESTTNNAAVEEDATFFTRASRRAARERYEMLLSGKDPFGLFGEVSTIAVDGASPAVVNASLVDDGGVAAEDPSIVATESMPDSASKSKKENGSSDIIEPPKSVHDGVQSPSPSSIGTSSQKAASSISDSQYLELLSTISASGNHTDQHTGDASGSAPDRYNFQRRLLEARLTMDAKKTASPRPPINLYTAEEAENKLKPWPVSAPGAPNAFESQPEKEDISSSPPVAAVTVEKNVVGPGCIRKVAEDSTVDKVTYRNREELHRDLFPNEEVQDEETISTGSNNIMDTVVATEAYPAVHHETSTIKEDHRVLEKGTTPNGGGDKLADSPSDESPSTNVLGNTELNDENVAMGLLVMTRSLMTLKQILDSKREQG